MRYVNGSINEAIKVIANKKRCLASLVEDGTSSIDEVEALLSEGKVPVEHVANYSGLANKTQDDIEEAFASAQAARERLLEAKAHALHLVRLMEEIEVSNAKAASLINLIGDNNG